MVERFHGPRARLKRGGFVACVAAAAVAASCETRATEVQSPGLALHPCHLDTLAEEVLCGVLEVYEDRTAGTGPRLPIHVAVLPPLRRAAAADPLVMLAGGPGQGARGLAGVAARYFRPIRRSRAIVLVDLRGTGASAPLDCLADHDVLHVPAGGGDRFSEEAAACLAELDRDPRHYTHANALADLDEVRRALGYRQVDLWGGSWGTRAALLYALRYPEATRRVVLDGAVALDMEFPRTAAADAQRALDMLADRCGADPACARTYPDLRQLFATALARVDAAAITVNLRHPRTGAFVDVTLTRGTVAEAVRAALYTPFDAARVPWVLARAVAGDYAPLAAQIVHSSSITSDDMALGATMAILCSEDLPRVRGVDFAADARGSLFRSHYADVWLSRCASWPAGPPLTIDPGATSAAPALVLSGTYDPVTPPRAGEAMRRWFPDFQHVVVDAAAHNASFTGCVPDIVAAFLDGRAVDPSCTSEAALPPLVVDAAGGRP